MVGVACERCTAASPTLLCWPCQRALVSCLADVPEVLAELRVNVARLNSRVPSAAPVRVAGAFPPLPIDDAAHECLTALTLLLRQAVLFFRGAGVAVHGDVAGSPVALATALRERVPAFARVEGVGLFADEMAQAIQRAWAVIDLPPDPPDDGEGPAWERLRERAWSEPGKRVTAAQAITIFPTLNKARLRNWRKRGIVTWSEDHEYRLGDLAAAVAMMDGRAPS